MGSKRSLLVTQILSALNNPSNACQQHHHQQRVVHQGTVMPESSKDPDCEYAFEMVSSTLRFGAGVTRELGQDFANMGCKRVMVVTDQRLSQLGAVRSSLDSLTTNRVKYELYDRVRIEPTELSCQDAVEFARKGNFDGFVAIGGGSSIDTAKCCALYEAHPRADFLDFVSRPVGRQLHATNRVKPLIAVPTTAGTGSETTTTAIIDFQEEKVKSAIRHRAIKPVLALLDPENVATMPKYVAVYSGLDVLCHALESFTAKPYTRRKPRPIAPQFRPTYQGSNFISDVWARETLRIIRRSFLKSVRDPADLQSKSEMIMAASFAGMGFGNAGVHLCHALAYPISGLAMGGFESPDYPLASENQHHPHRSDFKHSLIPHGLSVVTTACADFAFSAVSSPDRHMEAAELLGADVSNKPLRDAGRILADTIRGYIRDLEVPNGLKALGFHRHDCSQLAKSVLVSQPTLLNLCPRDQTYEELCKLYDDSLTIY